MSNYFIFKKVEIKKVKIFIFTFLLSFGLSTFEQNANFDKFLWITADSMQDKESINQALYFAYDHDFKKVFVQCRFRGDSFYNSKIVPKNNIVNPDFDPLKYAIFVGHQLGLEVHAWMNTYILWSNNGVLNPEPTNLNHIYHTNKDWLESNIHGKSDALIDLSIRQSPNWEGVYLSPNHPEVNEYLISVFKEVLDNYEIDGLHLDYIRFQNDIYGYNRKGRELFQEKYDFDPLDIERNIISSRYGWQESEIDSMKVVWSNYKINNINNLLLNLKKVIDNQDKDIYLSAAVKSNPDSAKNKWSQDWVFWLDSDLLDFAVLMNYAPNSTDFYNSIGSIKDHEGQDLNKIVMGISTYNQDSKKVSEKIYLSYLYGFKGISLFSYNSIEKNQKTDLNWFYPIIDIFNTIN